MKHENYLAKLISLIILSAALITGCGSGITSSTETSLPTTTPTTMNTLSPAPTMTAPLAASDEVEDGAGRGIVADAVNMAEAPLPQAAAPSTGETKSQTETTPLPPDGEPVDMFFADYGVNPFLDTADDHLSTFAMDVDTGSYTLVRSYLMDYGQLPDPEAVRSEEFINYFDVNYAGPEDSAFALHLTAAPAPFGYDDHYLLRVGVQGRYVAPEDRDPALLVFVIDVSGSMDRGDR